MENSSFSVRACCRLRARRVLLASRTAGEQNISRRARHLRPDKADPAAPAAGHNAGTAGEQVISSSEPVRQFRALFLLCTAWAENDVRRRLLR